MNNIDKKIFSESLESLVITVKQKSKIKYYPPSAKELEYYYDNLVQN